MNEVLARASNTLDRVSTRWRSQMGRHYAEPEAWDDDEEEEGSSVPLFFWGLLTALVLWWVYLRPARGEPRMAALAEDAPGRPPEPRPGTQRTATAPARPRMLSASAEEAAAEAAEPDDDLTRILGIGPARATRLHEAGITTYAALAMADAEQLRDILTGVGVGVGNADVATWPRQASLAAKGDWEGLEAYQAQLRAER